QLFIAGIVPGILLTLAFMAYILISNIVNRTRPVEAEIPFREKVAALRHLVAPMLVFGVVMGSIYFGVATPTESAGLGVVIALIFALIGGRLTWPVLSRLFIRTAELTGMIILI